MSSGRSSAGGHELVVYFRAGGQQRYTNSPVSYEEVTKFNNENEHIFVYLTDWEGGPGFIEMCPVNGLFRDAA